MAMGYLTNFLSTLLSGKRAVSGRWSVLVVIGFVVLSTLAQVLAETSVKDTSRGSASLAETDRSSTFVSLLYRLKEQHAVDDRSKENGRDVVEGYVTFVNDTDIHQQRRIIEGSEGDPVLSIVNLDAHPSSSNEDQGLLLDTIPQGITKKGESKASSSNNFNSKLQAQQLDVDKTAAHEERLSHTDQAAAKEQNVTRAETNDIHSSEGGGEKEGLSMQKKYMLDRGKGDRIEADGTERVLLRQKRRLDPGGMIDVDNVHPVFAGGRSLLSVSSKENIDYYNSSIFFEPERRKSSRSKVKYPARLTRQEDELRARAKKEPEHKLYSEYLLLRRLKDIHAENKLRNKNKLQDAAPENIDSWESELAIRNTLAERAIEYGIEQRQERLRNPDPNRELSLGQRIKKDAEEILRRRKEENGGVSLPKHDRFIRIEIPVVEIEQLMPPARTEHSAGRKKKEGQLDEDFLDETNENKTKNKKTPKAIRKLLSSATGKMESRSSSKSREVFHFPVHKADDVDRQVMENIDENFLKLEDMLHMGGLSRREQKRLKRQSKDNIREMNRVKRDAYYRSIGLPLLKVPDSYYTPV